MAWDIHHVAWYTRIAYQCAYQHVLCAWMQLLANGVVRVSHWYVTEIVQAIFWTAAQVMAPNTASVVDMYL